MLSSLNSKAGTLTYRFLESHRLLEQAQSCLDQWGRSPQCLTAIAAPFLSKESKENDPDSGD
ncbi:hypothetical protein H6F86_29045 [Phormidium sp. FACHB-592]|uniref:Uncharacterized protein n=1 Tax=Stenomitos frigidus AS-A4 TaxID=2933935 RepID=A0ABV0KDC8_9CYAN|nr:hypothetical protein [Phormidium sp. FACHB-592]MBD2077864.1 hypothetical protein [Phormidium sp. FACHB-592]